MKYYSQGSQLLHNYFKEYTRFSRIQEDKKTRRQKDKKKKARRHEDKKTRRQEDKKKKRQEDKEGRIGLFKCYNGISKVSKYLS